jgi:hypothetical protein
LNPLFTPIQFSQLASCVLRDYLSSVTFPLPKMALWEDIAIELSTLRKQGVGVEEPSLRRTYLPGGYTSGFLYREGAKHLSPENTTLFPAPRELPWNPSPSPPPSYFPPHARVWHLCNILDSVFSTPSLGIPALSLQDL